MLKVGFHIETKGDGHVLSQLCVRVCIFLGLMPLASQESSDSLAAEIVTPEIR